MYQSVNLHLQKALLIFLILKS